MIEGNVVFEFSYEQLYFYYTVIRAYGVVAGKQILRSYLIKNRF